MDIIHILFFYFDGFLPTPLPLKFILCFAKEARENVEKYFVFV